MKHFTKMQLNVTYVAIIGLVVAVTSIAHLVSLFATYPSESHRTIARDTTTLQTQMWTGSNFSDIMESEEYKSLIASSEHNYSSKAEVATSVLDIVMRVVIIGAIYTHLRHRLVKKKAFHMTVLSSSLGSIPVIVAGTFTPHWLIGTPTPSLGVLTFNIILGICFVTLLNAVITNAFKLHYDRKHSFDVE